MAKCKLCSYVLQGIFSKMETHQKICTMNENNDLLMKEKDTRKIQPKKTFSGAKINYLFQYATVTIQKQGDNLDSQIVRFFFACNIPFSSVGVGW